MTEYVTPGMVAKELRGAFKPKEVLDELFFNNKQVKLLFFLNQFSLKKIYDHLAKTDPVNIAIKERELAEKKKESAKGGEVEKIQKV